MQNINNVPHGIALRFRRNCETGGKFKYRQEEYKTYLTVRVYNPGLVNKKFENVRMMSRNNARGKNTITR